MREFLMNRVQAQISDFYEAGCCENLN